MTSSVAPPSARLRLARWLLIPVALGLFALVGMAVSTEDRSRAQADQSPPRIQPMPNDQSDASSPPAGGIDGPDSSSTTVTLGSRPATPTSAPSSGPQPSDDQSGTVPGGRQPVNFDVAGPAGRVGIDLAGPNPVARAVDAQGGVVPAVELQDGPDGPAIAGTRAAGGDPSPTAAPRAPGAEGPITGLRLRADGHLEAVGQGQIQPGDLVVAPRDGGLDVLRTDGSRIEIRRSTSGAGAGLQTLALDPSGGATPVASDAEGIIAVGDGITIHVPRGGTGPDGQPSDSPGQPSPTGHRRWLLAAAVVLTLAGGAAVYAGLHRRRRPAPEPFGPDWVGPTGIPANRFGEFLAMLSADPDPGRAIRLAFSAAERGLGHLPRRASHETPFEWYRRVAADHPPVAEPLAGLCACFANARFAPGPASPAERDSAVTELGELFRLSRDLTATSAIAGPAAVLVGAGAGVGAGVAGDQP